MPDVEYHGWTHRPKELGGTDPIPGLEVNAPVVNLPIDLRNPSADAYFSLRSLASGIPMGFWAFVKDVDASIMGMVVLPASFNTVAVTLYLSSSTVATGDVVMTVSTRAVSVGTNLAGSFSTETSQTVAITASLATVTFPTSGALASSPAPGDLLEISIQHLGTDGSDTLAVDLLMAAAILEVT